MGSGLRLISLGPRDRGADSERSEADSEGLVSCRSLVFLFSTGFSRES